MAPVRRQSNGRSPLVNQQSQITSFFTKKNTANSSSPSPPIISNPNPNGRESSPATPSPFQSKKPLLVIGDFPSVSPITPVRVYGNEVVQRRIKVYWPLDKDWYEGVVMSYDGSSGMHLVRYDDAEEEMLDLGKERFEWVEVEERSGSRKFKRLRRGVKFEAEEVVAVEEGLENSDGGNVDDSSDEDWGKNVVEEEDEECVDLEDEEIVDGVVGKSRGKGLDKRDCKKRKGSPNYLGSAKKNKNSSVANNGRVKASTPGTLKNWESGNKPCILDHVTSGDASERFSMREAGKFHFLGVDRRDAKQRYPGDPDYDPKTLYLPPDFLKSLTGCQKQWWEFKSKHMDKVLFFKMGKFYELFEMDAHTGAKELNLQYMKGDQPHCGFPEKNFSMNVEKLARKGYRVLVVEQTETPEQLEIRRKEKGCKDKVVKREICAMVTKGTLTEGELLSANPEASYLMAITESQILAEQNVEHIFGVCLVDVSTSRIILGQFKDDMERSMLCCILSELRPVEIIKPLKLLSPETERVLATHTRNPLVNDLIPDLEFWDVEKTIHEVKLIYKCHTDQLSSGTMKEVNAKRINSCEEDELGGLPEVLLDLMHAGDGGSLAISALGGTLYYLKQAFLDETLFRYASFELLPCSSLISVVEKPYMVLDAAALENLEIFENSRNGGSSGTLYAQLNHCITAFGKRLLKSWLARPLYHPESIKERQDAIACLHGDNLPSALEFRKALCRLPDMERLLSRIFASSESNGRTASNVVLYEDASKKQLQEFISALRGCELMDQACSSLGVILDNADARLLHQLLTPGKALPDIGSIIKHFRDAFDWVEACNLGRIIPHEGVDENYDSACKKVKEIESAFAKHLKEQRKLLGETSITYVTVGKDAYLLEVPEGLRGSVPREYELRSSKKGYFRYWNPMIKKSLGELSHAESEKQSTLKCILQRLIGHFCQHHNKWRQLTSATAELDVLISLAIARDYYEGPTCRPVIIDSSSSTEVPCLSAKSLGHPALRNDSLSRGSFVPNNITVGGSDHARFILLTGPNMGGKSTLLRQVCLAVILAQIGADVPAESFELSPVDRIFVRMGAKDHIMAGQSTFLTELSETASMLSSATCNSLVALDELGRGTSTSDGQAIAESVLEHFVHKVQCLGMFSTHYHRLSVDYGKNSKVLLCHMACHVGKGVRGLEEVTFLYKLTPGACPKSYGVNVARIAGLPDSVLKQAATKSREFESTYGNHMERSENKFYARSSTNEMAVLIENLFQVATKSSCDESPETISIASLNDLQSRARILLQQN